MSTTPRRRAPWTTDDDDMLKDHWGVWSIARIAEAQGRSIVACQVRAKRIGVNACDNILSGRTVARMFGVDEHVVTRWIAARLLTARRSGVTRGPYRMWNVTPQAVERFIARHRDEYDWRRMEPSYYRTLARAAWDADPLLTLREIAALHGVSRECVMYAVRAGRLPGKRSQVAGANRPWRVARSDALTFAPVRPELVGHAGRGKGRTS